MNPYESLENNNNKMTKDKLVDLVKFANTFNNGGFYTTEKGIVNEFLELEERNKKINQDFLDLIDDVVDWADEKGILTKATPIKQALKTSEEVLELQNAILDDDRAEIKDAIGDIMVTIIIQAKMQNLDIRECLQSAYDVISKRTGKMINGQFVKDEN